MEDRHRLNNFVKDGSERSVQDIVSKLKFISKIKEGELVDVHTLTIIESGVVTSLYRTFITRSESRRITLDFFHRIIGSAFDMIALYLEEKGDFGRQIGIMILNSLKESKDGIISHGKTYRKDRMYKSEIETLILTLDTKLIIFTMIMVCLRFSKLMVGMVWTGTSEQLISTFMMMLKI